MATTEAPRLRNDLDLISAFQHRTDTAILSITTTTSGKAWIGTANNVLDLVDQTGEVKVTVKLNNPPVFSTITNNGSLIISHGLSQQTKLIQISTDGAISEFVDLAPCEAIYDVKVTTDNSVLVCKETSFFDNIGKLVKFSDSGEKIWEIGRDVLKYCPTRVTEMPDGNYCVKVKDKLVFLTASGKFIRQTGNSHELSTVCTIVCDRFGHLVGGSVISDTDTQFIYLLDTNGQCVKKYTMPDSARLYVVAIDADGAFWVGKDNGEVVIARYLQ